MTKYASIDIGTNTLLLLIAKLENKKIKVIKDIHGIARLGEGSNDKIILENAIIRAENLLREYKQLIEKEAVEEVKIVATSAIRNSRNKNYVLSRLSQAIGYDILVISGDEEANLSFIGSVENDKDNTVLDIGGGSTELIVGKQDAINYRKSIEIGAVKISEKFFKSHNDKILNYLDACNYVNSMLKDYDYSQIKGKFIAVAGTPTTIASIDLGLKKFSTKKVHNHIVSNKNLEKIIEIIKNFNSDELVKMYGIHPNRADVILGGTVILNEFLKISKFESFEASCLGLRYGVLKSMLKD